jgi:hypothetical protein
VSEFGVLCGEEHGFVECDPLRSSVASTANMGAYSRDSLAAL